eukprot:14160757-Alexandrium_andersonii.AAC.1
MHFRGHKADGPRPASVASPAPQHLQVAEVGLGNPAIRHDCLGKADGEACIAECAGGHNMSGYPS